MFYVNDEPEGKFLYTETIKWYCSLYCIVLTSSRVLLELLECVALFLDLDGLQLTLAAPNSGTNTTGKMGRALKINLKNLRWMKSPGHHHPLDRFSRVIFVP